MAASMEIVADKEKDASAHIKPKFAPLTAKQLAGSKVEFRKISVPPHRYTPLKEHWMELYTPIFEQMKIDIRMNLKVC